MKYLCITLRQRRHLRSQTPTGALPLNPAGEFRPSDPSMPTPGKILRASMDMITAVLRVQIFWRQWVPEKK